MLGRNPLILSLIALVHYRRRDLPQGRTKLYQECLEILLEVRDKEDKELDVKGLSLNAKETILSDRLPFSQSGDNRGSER